MSENICNYRPIINLSQREINERFKIVHRYLCYVAANVGSSTFELVITPVTDTSYSIGAAQTNTVFTNEGASDVVVFSLPPAVAGLTYTFTRENINGIEIIPSSGDTIRVGVLVGNSSQSVVSDQQGDSITFVAVNSTEWIAIAIVGTWTIPIPP